MSMKFRKQGGEWKRNFAQGISLRNFVPVGRALRTKFRFDEPKFRFGETKYRFNET